MREVRIATEMIRLGQLLKLAGLIDSSGEAKAFLAEVPVTVNGQAEDRRGVEPFDLTGVLRALRLGIGPRGVRADGGVGGARVDVRERAAGAVADLEAGVGQARPEVGERAGPAHERAGVGARRDRHRGSIAPHSWSAYRICVVGLSGRTDVPARRPPDRRRRGPIGVRPDEEGPAMYATIHRFRRWPDAETGTC